MGFSRGNLTQGTNLITKVLGEVRGRTGRLLRSVMGEQLPTWSLKAKGWRGYYHSQEPGPPRGARQIHRDVPSRRADHY